MKASALTQRSIATRTRASNLAVPAQRHVLSTVAEHYGRPLRHAADLLSSQVTEDAANFIWDQLYSRRRPEPGARQTRPKRDLAAKMVVGAWSVGVATGRLPASAKLIEAEEWFLGDLADHGFTSLVPSDIREEAEHHVSAAADKLALYDLLPYVLDPHGEGSRSSVMRRPGTKSARARKKTSGVFYTPADVASFMASSIVKGMAEDAMPLTIFDPACGSGVFLRAVLSELSCLHPNASAFDLACSSLFGADIDPWAPCAAALVVLADSIDSALDYGMAPLAAWHLLRLNLVHLDTLRLDPGDPVPSTDTERIERLACRAELRAGRLPGPVFMETPKGPIKFQRVFPEIAEGPRLIIGNPPYAALGDEVDLSDLSNRFRTLRAAPRPTSDMYPLFVEQMVRLTAPNAHGGAMVLPLSLAFATTKQVLALRSVLAQTSGDWRFAFFDREPHALFGEDVKTRNSIVLWLRNGTSVDVQVSTGPLRKWRSHDRHNMFASITYTPIDTDIRPGIPKLDGNLQSEVYLRLQRNLYTLKHVVPHIGRQNLHDALHSVDRRTVYVGPTAYNFLNVFLRPESNPHLAGELSENPLHALSCPTRRVAHQVFAILSSRFAFWWWHIKGDGFHVAKNIIKSLPVGVVLESDGSADELDRLGATLWEEVSSRPILSRNRSRTSIAFSPIRSEIRAAIDRIVIEGLGLPAEFSNELAEFCDKTTNAVS